MTNRHLMETQNLVISFDYSWFLAKNLAYAECLIMKFHYRNSSTVWCPKVCATPVSVIGFVVEFIFIIQLGFLNNKVNPIDQLVKILVTEMGFAYIYGLYLLNRNFESFIWILNQIIFHTKNILLLSRLKYFTSTINFV